MRRCITRKFGISSITAACTVVRTAIFTILLGAVSPLAAQTAPSKFVPMFLVYYGGGPALVATDAPKLAKFDLLDIDRFRYNQLPPSTWSAIKALNPNIQIYLYEMGPESQNYMDATPVVSINGLGRHDVSRGHSMGSLDGNHPELFLLDSSGNRIYNAGFSNPAGNQFWYLMDFGSPTYQAYWIEAVRTDIANQPWVADGVHADNCLTFWAAGGYSATSSKYPTDSAWSSAMNNFSSAAAAGLHGFGQKLWCNKGSSYIAAGAAAWLALDASPDHPDVLAEEGAFAVTFGPWATQFISEANWKLQVDTMAAIKNSKVAMFSSTALGEGQSGTDNWGQPVTYWQTLWYSLGSFLLGKNDTLNNAYFGFFGNGGAYDRIWWYNEYDKIDLGKALGSYTVTTIGGVNIYSREFEKGYVYVNPTATNVASVTLTQASQQLTHDNLLSLLSSIPIVNAISLNGHNTAIVLKTVVAPPVSDTTPPTVPAGVSASAASSTQINLSWAASTDNVAVTGYRVYRGGSLLTTLGAVTTLQNTGLSAATTYSYTVEAIDAAGNASGQSAAASATTPAAPDTTAPSTPSGLSASAASSSQISLSWTASTDNVAVTGYRVYRDGSLLTTLGAVTTLQNTGLSAATTYSYTVQVIDAAGNASDQSAAASATTPAATDTTPPSVPTGLKGRAGSPTQVNLTWHASIDNVGVAGYTVYLNDAVLATTTGRSFQHTGLAPGTAYSYRVSAYDAARNNSAWTATPVSVKTPARRIVRGDFDGDGKSDVLWRNAATGANAIWLMNGATTASATTFSTVADLTWKIAGVGDFDGDGKADILWRNAAGGNVIWLMNGAAILSDVAVNGVTDFNWSIAGIGDFDGDGRSDILWHNNATGANSIWLMNGGTISGGAVAFATVADLNWSVAGTGDFDGDGKSDILWHNSATGENLLWFMNGAAIVSAVSVSAMTDLNWTIAGTGDFDGNGKADILWRNPTTGEDVIWFMNGATLSSSPAIGAVMDLNWSIAGIGDFDGDGKSDILWRNQVTGQDSIWFMNGATLSSGSAIDTVGDLNWSITPR